MLGLEYQENKKDHPRLPHPLAGDVLPEPGSNESPPYRPNWKEGVTDLTNRRFIADAVAQIRKSQESLPVSDIIILKSVEYSRA